MALLQGLFGPPDVAKLEAKRDVRGLIKALRYNHKLSVCQAAIQALGRIGDSLAVEPLVGMLDPRTPEYLSVRVAACEALEQIGDVRAVKPLVRASLVHAPIGDSRNPLPLRDPAIHALLKIGKAAVEPLMEQLRSYDPEEVGMAAFMLEKLGDARAVEPLMEVLTEPYRGYVVNSWDISTMHTFVIKALGQIGDARAVEPLVAKLKVDNVSLRCCAAEALGRIGDARAVEPLVAALGDSRSESARVEVATALGKMADARAVEPLMAIVHIKEDLWYPLRRTAWTALAEIGQPAVGTLVAALKDDSICEEAALALGQIGDSRAVDTLVEVLKSGGWYSRPRAAAGLGRIGDSRAVEPLVMALGAADGATRRAAAQALVQFYRSGTLTADDKNLILGQREIMATPHGDQVHSWCNISSSHTDEGIGVLI